MSRSNQVLVIDDDEMVGDILRAFVLSRGDRVVIAKDGRLGLELFVSRPIDVVFCDVVMPSMDGLEFLEKARAHDPEVPIILMTAYADKQKLTRAVQLNAFDFLEKPLDQGRLDVCLERAVLQRRVLLQRQRSRRSATRVEELVRRMNATRELSPLYHLLEHEIADALDVSSFAIFARVGDTLECRAGSGLARWHRSEWSGPASQCLNQGRSLDFEDPQLGFGSESESESQEVGMGVCLPLRIESQRWGMLVLYRARGAYDDSDRRNFRLISDHVASSIAVRERSAELERALQALEEAQGRLLRIEKLASVTKLVAGMAHEIKNPLTSMQFAVANAREELRDLEPDPERRAGVAQFLDVFTNDLERLCERVDRFMQLARPEAVLRQHVDTAAVVRRVVTSIAPRADALRVDLRMEIEAVPEIEVDSEALESAVLNLVVNSLEALAESGAARMLAVVREPEAAPADGVETHQDSKREIRVAVDCNDQVVRITVQDTGPGLSVDARERMFDIFFTTKASGVGLGLSQVHVFVENHGGQIRWNSSSNGTRFDLMLPRRISERL